MKDYIIKELSAVEFRALIEEPSKKFFEENSQIFNLRESLTKNESSKLSELASNLGQPIRINLGLFHNDVLIGWSWGYQESAFKFYMCNSAIFPEYRRKGMYKKLLEKMVEKVKDLGFQEIYSRHTSTNNDIIIPKLKFGFVISSLEVNDVFGVLVHLTYFLSPLRRKMLDYRVGQIKPDEEIKKYLGI